MLFFQTLIFFFLGAYAMATPLPTTSGSGGKAGLSLLRRAPAGGVSLFASKETKQAALLKSTEGYWWRVHSFLVNITLLISPRMNLTCLDSQEGGIMWYIWTAKGSCDQSFLRRWMRRIMEQYFLNARR